MERFADLSSMMESKASVINRMNQFTDEQKKTLIDFFDTHNDYEKMIDWNRATSKRNPLTWDDFEELFDLVNSKNLPQEGIDKLGKGVDYDEIPWDEGKAYAIYTHRGSVAIACNHTEPKTWSELPSWYQVGNADHDYPHDRKTDLYGGAKWCTAMHHTDHYFKDYTRSGNKILFYFIYQGSKYAMLLEGTLIKGIWDAKDENVDFLFGANSTITGHGMHDIFEKFIDDHKKEVRECEEKFKGMHTEVNSEERQDAIDEWGEGVVCAFESWYGEDDTPYDRIVEYYITEGDAEDALWNTESEFGYNDITQCVDMEELGEMVVDDDMESLSEEEFKDVYYQYYNDDSGEYEFEYERIASEFIGEICGSRDQIKINDLYDKYRPVYERMDFDTLVRYYYNWEQVDGYWFS